MGFKKDKIGVVIHANFKQLAWWEARQARITLIALGLVLIIIFFAVNFYFLKTEWSAYSEEKNLLNKLVFTTSFSFVMALFTVPLIKEILLRLTMTPFYIRKRDRQRLMHKRGIFMIKRFIVYLLIGFIIWQIFCLLYV